MVSLAFLVTELQALASETRRKHPDVREAAEKSLAILRASPDQAAALLSSDGPAAKDILRPLFAGCTTKHAKAVLLCLGSLQRLITLRLVPPSTVPSIVTTMAECASQGVDIQLKILQTLLSLVTNFKGLHGAMLGSALLLCFKLHESRTAVVSSTAAATLRQLVMFVFDKVSDEDSAPPQSASPTTLPDGKTAQLHPAAQDAFYIFQDLCLLATSSPPLFLALDSLPKTFALELIESVLTNYYNLFRAHRELVMLLRHDLSPLLLKLLSVQGTGAGAGGFPLVLRATRVVFLLLKQFSGILDTEAEVFMMLLVRIVGGADPASSSSSDTVSAETRPTWTRVCALEILRGLCADAELMRYVYDRFDGRSWGAPSSLAHSEQSNEEDNNEDEDTDKSEETEPSSAVFTALVGALTRMVTERPVVLGTCAQMQGANIPHTTGVGAQDVQGGYAGMVVNAANATVSTVSGVVGMGMGTSGGVGVGLSVQDSAMKLQCIDQLDKADAPPIPETYIYLLGAQCLVSLADGFATLSAPLFTSLSKARPRAPGDTATRAPPALDLSTLPKDDPNTKALHTVHQMLETTWPAFLASTSFLLNTNLSDELFVDILASTQALTNVLGMLGLSTPRDAFLSSLSRSAVPTRVVGAVDAYIEPPTPRTATASISEGLGLGSAPHGPPGLSERNTACLKVLISSAVFLAGSLDKSWFGVLETVQNADYVLSLKGMRRKTGSESGLGPGALRRASTLVASSSQGSGTGAASAAGGTVPVQRHPLLSDLEPEQVLGAIQRLFDTSKNMADDAFRHFVGALCKLSLAMVGMQAVPSPLSSTLPLNEEVLGGDASIVQRRRVSGIHLQATHRSGDFAITKLGGVALLNISRLVHKPANVGWDTVVPHLLSVLCSPHAPPSIRTQAAKVLDELLLVVPRHLANAPDENLKADVQKRVIDALAQQVVPDTLWNEASSTRVELSRMGLEALHDILQGSGHTLLVGWETIFGMLADVCKPLSTRPAASVSTKSLSTPSTPTPAVRARPPALGLASERSYTALVKVAFKSLQLVCDTLSSLSASQLRACIATIGCFGRQADTNIALTAAESLLWSVSDSIQSTLKARASGEGEMKEYVALWMFLLLEILGLCTDERPAVRVGAIQTLFRTLQLYGATLSLETWDECIWKITLPLLSALKTAAIVTSVPAEEEEGEVQLQDQAPWNDSKILALQSIGTMFSQSLGSKIIHLESFGQAWDVLVAHIRDAVLLEHRSVAAPALRCLHEILKAATEIQDESMVQRKKHMSEKAWECSLSIGNAVSADSEGEPSADTAYSQESLVTYVEVVKSIRAIDGTEWELSKLSDMAVRLKGVLTYAKSFDFRPDVDNPSPLQALILDVMTSIDRSAPGVASLVLQQLAEYVTLPFRHAFDAPQISYARPGTTAPAPTTSSGGRKRVTYVGLGKKIMPLLVQIYLAHREQQLIYEDKTLQRVFGVFEIPIKLKYSCPAPSKFGKDMPMWKTATSDFLRIISTAVQELARLEPNLSDDVYHSIWRQILDVYRGGLLADCSAVQDFDPEDQERDEAFDRSWLASLEVDILPHIGHSRVPSSLLEYLAKILREGSRLHEFTPSLSDSSEEDAKNILAPKPDRLDRAELRDYDEPTTNPGVLLPREQFSYWCLDVLFSTCSSALKGQESTQRRIAALLVPALLSRCRSTLASFVADGSLRGDLPFSRAREEEVLYILMKILDLRLWPGSLWAALSDSPSEYCVTQPPIDPSLPLPDLLADAIRRTPQAHLFHLYPSLCDIVSAKCTAFAWMPVCPSGVVERVDAKELAAQCLALIGREMGMQR